MKTLFEKFKASVMLDRDRQAAGENSLRALDDKLREPRGNHDVPSGLHGDIMRAVRVSSRETGSTLVAVWWPRFAAVALVLVVAAGVFWSLDRVPVKVPDVASAAEAPSLMAAIEQGHALTQSAPEAMLQPLSGELEALNVDLQKAVDFVVASVP